MREMINESEVKESGRKMRGFYLVLEFTLFERYKSGGSVRYDVMHLFNLTKHLLIFVLSSPISL